MNLFDIVKRNDRCLSVKAGAVTPARVDGRNCYLGASFERHSEIVLKEASEFTCLAGFPRDIGWSIVQPRPDAPFRITLRGCDSGREHLLGDFEETRPGRVPLLTWPACIGTERAYDLVLSTGRKPIVVASSPVFDTRLALRPFLKGDGVEVGPGLNPIVKPGPDVRIRYAEAMTREDWLKNYAKKRSPTPEDEALWSLYTISDAHHLEGIADNSLDFVFSNHVFEHLMNPLGVLKNWLAKLKPGGTIVSVVPDLRFCFDLRQEPSTPSEWEDEYNQNLWVLPRAKYEKWSRKTAPDVTVESLIARNYSVHSHYYMPDTFRTLLQSACKRFGCSRFFLNTSPNNKDFGFVLWRD